MGQRIGFVPPRFPTAQNRENGGPEIQVGQRTAQAGTFGVILSEIRPDKYQSKYNGDEQHGQADALCGGLYPLVGEHKVPEQKTEQIDAEAVGCENRQIADLRAQPDRNRQKQNHRSGQVSAERIQTIFAVELPDEHQKKRKQPEHLNKPQRSGAGEHNNRNADRKRNAV